MNGQKYIYCVILNTRTGKLHLIWETQRKIGEASQALNTEI